MKNKGIKQQKNKLWTRCISLIRKGRLSKCRRLVERSLPQIYRGEDWQARCPAFLQLHRKSCPAMNDGGYQKYRKAVLHKKKLPAGLGLLPAGADPWSGRMLQEKAMERVNRQQWEEAVSLSRLAVRASPLSSIPYLLLGQALEMSGEKEEGAKAYLQALQNNGESWQACAGAARCLEHTAPANALEWANRGLSLAPEQAELYLIRARIYRQQGEFWQAVAQYNRAMELEPRRAAHPFEKGELLLEAGQEDGARQMFNEALERNSAHLPALLRLARLEGAKNPAKGLARCLAALRADANCTEALLLAGEFSLAQKNKGGAQGYFLAAAGLDEANALAWGGLGECRLGTNPQDALECFEKAAALEPAQGEYRLGISRAQHALGYGHRAEKACSQALSLERKNHVYWAWMGELQKEKRPEKALECYERAAYLAPEKREYPLEQAKLYASMGQRREAAGCLWQGMEMDPGNPLLHQQMGLLLEELGSPASARSQYREALHQNPGLTLSAARLAGLMESSDPAQALVLLTKAIEEDAANGQYYCQKGILLASLALEEEERHDVVKQLQLLGPEQARGEWNALRAGETARLALFYFDRAVLLEPGDLGYRCARAELLEAMGQTEDAKREYREILKADSRRCEALSGLGGILARQGEKEGMRYLERALQQGPDCNCYLQKGALLERQNSWKKALGCYYRAGACEPADQEGWLGAGRCLEMLKRAGEAADCYRRALLLNRDCLYATVRLGALYQKSHPDWAMEYWKRAAELEPENPEWQAEYTRGEDKESHEA